MKDFIISSLVTAGIVFVLSYVLSGVEVASIWSAIWVALALSFLNAIVKPVLVFFTLPATVVTLGLFLLVINAVIILLADVMIDGFRVSGFWMALVFSICLSASNAILGREDGKK